MLFFGVLSVGCVLIVKLLDLGVKRIVVICDLDLQTSVIFIQSLARLDQRLGFGNLVVKDLLVSRLVKHRPERVSELLHREHPRLLKLLRFQVFEMGGLRRFKVFF